MGRHGWRRGRDWAVRPSVLPFSHFVPRTSSSSAILLSLQFCTAHYVIWRPAFLSASARLLEAEAARFNSAEMQTFFPRQGEVGETTDSGWKIRPSRA